MHVVAGVSRLTADDGRRVPSLFCEELPTVWDGLRRSFADPVMLNDDRVLQNLLTVEDRCLPSAKYFDFQLEIKPFMRRILTSWMLEVMFTAFSTTSYVTLRFCYELDVHLFVRNVAGL